MDGSDMKGIIVMIMLSVTLFLVLVHADEDHPLPLFAPPLQTSLHPFPLSAQLLSFSQPLQPSQHPFPLSTQLLSFSPHDDAKSQKKRTSKENNGSRALTEEQKEESKKCYRMCNKQRVELPKEPFFDLNRVERCRKDCLRKLGLVL